MNTKFIVLINTKIRNTLFNHVLIYCRYVSLTPHHTFKCIDSNVSVFFEIIFCNSLYLKTLRCGQPSGSEASSFFQATYSIKAQAEIQNY